MLSAGAAFLLAFLPSSLVTQLTKRALTEQVAATDDAGLRHAVEFSRKVMSIDERGVAAELGKLAAHAQAAGLTLPVAPTAASGIEVWLAAIAAVVTPALTGPALVRAWSAGEAARDAAVSGGVAAHVAYLRSAAPAVPELVAAARTRAVALASAIERLEGLVVGAGLPTVMPTTAGPRALVAAAPDLASAVDDQAFRRLNELARALVQGFESLAHAFDAPPPPPVTAPASRREQQLMESILANPDYDPPRLELAELAAARHDPRGELIHEQFAARTARDAGRTSDEARHQARARELVLSHPAWTAALVALGARDITFERGFPDGVTLNAADLFARGAELLGHAPITRVRLRDAAGKVAQLAATPVLARLAGLDLSEQGVTDDDVALLATSPYAERLRFLDLRQNRLTDRAIEALAASPGLRNLEVVKLDTRVPTEAATLLEAKYGRRRWLHPQDPE